MVERALRMVPAGKLGLRPPEFLVGTNLLKRRTKRDYFSAFLREVTVGDDLLNTCI